MYAKRGFGAFNPAESKAAQIALHPPEKKQPRRAWQRLRPRLGFERVLYNNTSRSASTIAPARTPPCVTHTIRSGDPSQYDRTM